MIGDKYLRDRMLDELKKPGDRIVLDDFSITSRRQVQIATRRAKPPSWEITTKTVGDELHIWRLT